MTELTAQQIFDKVARHLILQNAKSVGPTPEIFSTSGKNGFGCAYRGEEGRMCAAGCLIPDELYKPQMEGVTIVCVLAENVELQKLFADNATQLISQLQTVHDNPIKGPEHWPGQLETVAYNFGLNPEIIYTTLKERDANVQ